MQSTGAHKQTRAPEPLKNIFTMNEATNYSGEFWRIRENSNKKQDYLQFLGTFTKLRRTNIGFVMLIRLSVRMK